MFPRLSTNKGLWPILRGVTHWQKDNIQIFVTRIGADTDVIRTKMKTKSLLVGLDTSERFMGTAQMKKAPGMWVGTGPRGQSNF